jgi:hypothetical protein
MDVGQHLAYLLQQRYRGDMVIQENPIAPGGRNFPSNQKTAILGLEAGFGEFRASRLAGFNLKDTFEHCRVTVGANHLLRRPSSEKQTKRVDQD